MLLVLLVCALMALWEQASGQTRAELASRFGAAHAETFLLPHQIKLTATYDSSDHVCEYRMETPDHSERASPKLTDARFWIDSVEITRMIAELVPQSARSGPIQRDTIGLRVGERILIESDDTIQITRIQRSRPMLSAGGPLPVADRLVTMKWKRPECIKRTFAY
jgi:hypothetical protein